MNDNLILILKKELVPIFRNEPTVGAVYLFGSQANNTAGENSDYDFAVYFIETDVVKRNAVLFKISQKISDILKLDRVDIHSLNDIQGSELKFHIIKDGIVIFEREPVRILIEPKILNEYFDFVYLLRKYGLTRA